MHTWAVILFCLCYAAYLVVNSEPVAAGADCGGYLGSAKLLTEGRLLADLRATPEYRPSTPWPYTPHGYVPKGERQLAPSFPVGLPLHLAAGTRVLGSYWGPLAVQVLGAVATVALCFILLKELPIGGHYAAAAAIALGVSPLLLSVSYIPMSDAWATAWCLAAVICALRSHRAFRWAICAGAAASVALLIRPNSLLIVPALWIAAAGWKPLFGMWAGAAPLLAWGGWYNEVLYGAPWRTGYGSVSETLSVTSIVPSLANYVSTAPFVLPLGLGCVLLVLRPKRLFRRTTLVLLAWAVSFIGFFSFYSYTPTHWWYLRFVLPAFPALLGLGLLGWRSLIERVPSLTRRRDLALSMLLVAALGLSTYWAVIKKINRSAGEQSECAYAARWVEQHLPAGTLVGCSYLSAAVYYYTDLPVLRWEFMSPETFAEVRAALHQSRRKMCLVLREYETERALAALPGDWVPLATFRHFSVWQLQESELGLRP